MMSKNEFLLTRALRRLKNEGFRKFIYRSIRYVLIKYLIFLNDFEYIIIYFYYKFIKGKNLIIKEINKSKLLLDLKDKGISKELIINKIREPFSTRKMTELLKPGDIVMDIGSNIGYYAILEANIVGFNGEVIAIEPVYESFKKLSKNLDINNIKNVKLFNLGISNKSGVEEIFLSNKSNLATFVIKDNMDVKKIKKTSVNVVTVDEFLDKHNIIPNFLRMDVEGYEINIFKGMDKLLSSKNHLIIFIELHPFLMSEDDSLFIIKKLMDSGFKLKCLIFEYPFYLIKAKFIKKIIERLDYILDHIIYGENEMSINELVNSSFIKPQNYRILHLFFERL